jgi:microcystin-dependent protein
LFSLLGNAYGGDGTNTFALPNVQGRTIIGAGNGILLTPRTLGETGGSGNVALGLSQVPSHGHNLQAHTGLGDSNTASGKVLARGSHSYGDRVFSTQNANVDMHSSAVTSTGGNQPHNN